MACPVRARLKNLSNYIPAILTFGLLGRAQQLILRRIQFLDIWNFGLELKNIADLAMQITAKLA